VIEREEQKRKKNRREKKKEKKEGGAVDRFWGLFFFLLFLKLKRRIRYPPIANPSMTCGMDKITFFCLKPPTTLVYDFTPIML
jgi:hypothetical protein